jgi:predicted nucleotidyltransferase
MSDQLRSPITLDDLRTRRDEILALAEKYGAYNVRVFGSVARGESTSESDVDLLVQFPAHYKLLDHAGLLMDLKDLLGVEVDVSVEANLQDALRSRILKDAVRL